MWKYKAGRLLKQCAVMLVFHSCTLNAQVLSPFAQEDHERVKIGLFSPADVIEISHIYSEPEAINVDFRGVDGSSISIAEFGQVGSSLPKVISVFKGGFKERTLLMLIVKWYFYLPGVDTDADYYEIHVFNISKNPENGIHFSRNEFLSHIFGSGFDGRHEGERTYFRYKDAISVKQKLKELE